MGLFCGAGKAGKTAVSLPKLHQLRINQKEDAPKNKPVAYGIIQYTEQNTTMAPAKSAIRYIQTLLDFYSSFSSK